MKNIFTFLVATLFILNTARAQNVGDTAPDFTLKDLSNQDYKLSSDQGKVVLIFFIGNTCPNCIASSPLVKSAILDVFSSNGKFKALVIDTWDGSSSAVQNFKNSTSLNATFLQKGSSVASKWSITYDRLAVVDGQGKIVFKGTKAASSDANAAKTAIQSALNNLTTSVSDVNISEDFTLEQNFPNPFQNESKVKFSIGEPSEVILSVYNLAGKKVLVPVHQFYPSGRHEILINRAALKSGIYFYKLEAGTFSATKKLIVQ